MAHTISTQRFNKFRLQLELLATHTSYNAEEFVFKYYYSNVSVPTYNYGNIRLYSVQYKVGEYFMIEYYIGNVRLLDSYPINDGELTCNGVINEVVSCISDCIDCLLVIFTDKEVANDFMNSYLGKVSDTEDMDTIVYHYSGSDFVVVYTTDFTNKNAWMNNKFFVGNLVDSNLLNDSNVKNFKLLSHYVDMMNSDKDTECGLM